MELFTVWGSNVYFIGSYPPDGFSSKYFEDPGHFLIGLKNFNPKV